MEFKTMFLYKLPSANRFLLPADFFDFHRSGFLNFPGKIGVFRQETGFSAGQYLKFQTILYLLIIHKFAPPFADVA
jgi:hypothetical protein